ncbi:hypothetical protein P3T40_007074 [Paraburkholderia sp. EB58]|jgi:hypothetical protein|uniref:hypothetical protein n=1 Tax=Paraburkholderia sp. EB58 TaxID=3035125 RepID=UPI003D250022
MISRPSVHQCFGALAPLLLSVWLGVAAPGAHADPAASVAFSPKRSTADEKKRAADTPFEFRGIPLGITLDEFRAGSTVRATPVGSVPVCETDMLAGALGMSMKTSESLTVACRWAHRSADRWQVSQAVVDGAPAQDHVLRFARVAGQSALRLYEISFVIDEVTAGDLRDALADRYGMPRLVTKNTSAAGSVVPMYVWENAVSSITLCFLPSTHNGTLTYLLKDPDAWVKSLVRQWQASSPEAG